jgi:hypothetical protein
MDALFHLIRTQPICTLDDLLQIMGGYLPFCNPTEEVLQLVMPLLQEQLNAAAKIIPDQVTVIRPAPAGSNGPVTGLRLARFIMRASILIPFVFLFLVTLLAVRTPKGWMQWWGIPLFFAGAITLAVGLVALPILNLLWVNYVVPRFPAYLPGELVSVAHGFVVAVFQEFIKWIIVEAGIITLLGLGAWIGSYFIKNKNRLPS